MLNFLFSHRGSGVETLLTLSVYLLKPMVHVCLSIISILSEADMILRISFNEIKIIDQSLI